MVWKYDKNVNKFVLFQTLYYESDVKSVEMAYISSTYHFLYANKL